MDKNHPYQSGLFCSRCHTYLRSNISVCPACETWRQPIIIASISDPVWKVELGVALNSAPVVHENLLLMASGERGERGAVHALERGGGEILWRGDTTYPVSGVCVAGDKAIAVTLDFLGKGAQLWAWYLEDGKQAWLPKNLSAAAWSAPIVFEEKQVFVATSAGAIHCFDLASGRENSLFSPAQICAPLPDQKVWMFAVGEMMVVVYQNGQVFIRPRMSNKNQAGSSIDLRGRLSCPPALAGNILYAGTENGDVLGLDIMEKRLFHILAGLGKIPASPAYNDGCLFVAGADRSLQVVELASKHQKTLGSFKHSLRSAPLLEHGLAYVGVPGRGEGVLQAIYQECGEALWDYKARADLIVWNTPASADGLLYISNKTGMLMAVPWHGGQYPRAAELCASQKLFSQAADLFAMACESEACSPDVRREYHDQAIKNWHAAGEWYKSAYYRDDQPGEQPLDKAREFEEAAGMMPASRGEEIASLYHKASGWYQEGGDELKARECEKKASQAVYGPYISIRAITIRGTWEAGKEEILCFEIKNMGKIIARGVRLRFKGSLAKRVWVDVPDIEMGKGFEIEIPLLPAGEGQGHLDVDAFCIDPKDKPHLFMSRIDMDIKPAQGEIFIDGDAGAIYTDGLKGRIHIRGDVGIIKVKNAGVDEASNVAEEIREAHWPEIVDGFENDAVDLFEMKENLDKELLVRQGKKAYILADQRMVASVPPGRYTRKKFPELSQPILPGARQPIWDAALIHSGDVRLAYRLGPYNLHGADLVGVDLGITIALQLEKGVDFWLNMAQDKKSFNAVGLAERLNPEMNGVVKSWLQQRKPDELSIDFPQRETLALTLEEELRQNLARQGVKMVGSPWSLRIMKL